MNCTLHVSKKKTVDTVRQHQRSWEHKINRGQETERTTKGYPLVQRSIVRDLNNKE